MLENNIHIGVVKQRPVRRYILAGVSLLALAMLVVLIFLNYKSSTNGNTANGVPIAVNICSSPATIEAWNQFAKQASSSPTDYKMINNIKKVPGYLKDPNCLFVLTQYYFSITDYQDAGYYLAYLNKIYSTSQGLISAYGGKSFSLKALDEQLAPYQQASKSTINSFASGTPK